ncbi:TPA: single-stranded DNA-binding protein [Streptococcus pyogenes]|nr:single-stranded DNA-binding protein [Streptococcus pyogenes]HER3876551.1 single-stranded DNA-binding protein [Streptococcus pyogenes]
MINNVVLVGRMTRDAELRYTNSNIAVATFTLAVNRPFKNEAGEREADFINVVIWRQPAENLANWAKKGSLIGITGSIQTKNYENQQGQRVYVTEVVANNFQLLESRNSQQNNQGQSDHQQNQGNFGNKGQQGSFFEGNTTNPAPGYTNDNGPFGRSSNPLDISDDDLPF